MAYLRYIPSSALGAKFTNTRYPSKGEWTREKCQEVFEQMCGYGRLEIVDEDEGQEREKALEIRENGTKKSGPRQRANAVGPGASPTNKESTSA